jgi:hypothetical protein
MLNGRITGEQMEWLQARADGLGGNLSAALRQAITDARFLELARADFRNLVRDEPDFHIPRDEDGASRVVEVVLAFEVSEPADLELRRQETLDES